MCRFLAYLGSSPIVLSELIEQPSNSLINQSRSPKLCRGTSADGFGVAWYEKLGKKPDIYKSTKSAWNDLKIPSLMKKIQSTCFLSHVRAATVGGVSFANCHPFTFENYSFVHNGTIREVKKYRRNWLSELDKDLSVFGYCPINGHSFVV